MPGVGWKKVELVLSGVRNALVDGGSLVALERLATPLMTLQFARALSMSSLAVDWDRSHVLVADELAGGEQRFPIIVAERVENPGENDPAAALGLHDYDQFEHAEALSGGAAEALVRALRLDESLFAGEIHYDNGVHRIEHWRCGGIVLDWQSTSLGFRKAQLHSLAMASELRQQAEATLELCEAEGIRVAYNVEASLRADLEQAGGDVDRSGS